MGINFQSINRIFEKAEKEGRRSLLEHEFYEVLQELGIETPRFFFLKRGDAIRKKDLETIPAPNLVLKIVSPLILHKTDVGGVRFVRNNITSVKEAIKKMYEEIPRCYLENFVNSQEMDERQRRSLSEIEKSMRGILICEKVEYEQFGFGTELLLGLRNTREFGPVVTVGVGGVEVEFLDEILKRGKASAIFSANLLGKKDLCSLLQSHALYKKLSVPFRGKEAVLAEEELLKTCWGFSRIAAHYSAFEPTHFYVIEEAEANPFVVRGKKLIPLDGLCRFSRNHLQLAQRDLQSLRYLLHPRSIAIIGVSEKMNIGHIILNNILRRGFPRDKVIVVKPGLSEIEGCRCVPRVADLPHPADLFVLTLSAEQSGDVIKDLIEHEKARSVILIASGIGEKEGTRQLEEGIINLLHDGRKRGKLVPIVNGGNCLGIISRPGCFDTTFVPEHKLYKFPRPEAKKAPLVYISQSGAFMISRMSKLPQIEPLYAISLGNQLDLTASDYLNFLKDEAEARVFAVYIEGFKDGDGYALAKATREIVKAGKTVIVYKVGKTPEGKKATASHTASVAGDYNVARAVLESCGAMVAETLFDFESFIKGAIFLGQKKARGNRVGLVSNAGFEAVIMADNLKNDESLELATFSNATVDKLQEVLRPLGIDRLQDIKNPLDVTPLADDKVFCECARAIIEDENVDCAVISPVPMTTAMQTLAPGEGHEENLYRQESIAQRLIEIFRKTDKPMVVNIEAGEIYQPMVDLLEEAGIPVFRRCDSAVRFLRKYLQNLFYRKTI